MAMNVREAAAVEAMGKLMAEFAGTEFGCDLDQISLDATRRADSLVAALNKGRLKTKRGTFVADNPPTFEEVADYCIERGNQVNVQMFLDHYTSNGWKVGKNKTPMRDWKAAIRGPWEHGGDTKALGDWINGKG